MGRAEVYWAERVQKENIVGRIGGAWTFDQDPERVKKTDSGQITEADPQM